MRGKRERGASGKGNGPVCLFLQGREVVDYYLRTRYSTVLGIDRSRQDRVSERDGIG